MSDKIGEVLKARNDFEYFATNDNFIDQSEFHPEKGLVLKDYHREWLDAIEDNRKVAITAFTGSGKCLTKNTRVPMAEGGFKKIKEIKPGDKVLSLNERTLETESAKVSRFVENGEKKVYEVKTSDGREVEITSNHPMLTEKGWKSLDNGLSEGDYIAEPKNLPDSTNDLEKDEAAILGFLLAKGSLSGKGIGVSSGDEELVEKLNEKLESKNVVAKRVSDYDYSLTNIENISRETGETKRNEDGTFQESSFKRVSSAKEFVKEFELLGLNSKTKKIPRQVMNAGPESKAKFVGWMWAGDGYVSEPDSREVSICLANKKMLQQLQDLLLSLGIDTHLSYKETNKKGCDSWRLTVRTASIPRFAEKIDIPLERKDERLEEHVEYLEAVESNTNVDIVPVAGEEISTAIGDSSLKEFSEISGCSASALSMYQNEERKPSEEAIKKIHKASSKNNLKKYVDSDIKWTKVENIVCKGKKQTYDITVPKNHSFIANGLVSHNTSIPGVLYPLWRAFCEPGFEVLVVSATMQQATEILKKIKHHINESKYLSDLEDQKENTWNQTEIELTNDSMIKCKPLSKKVKGTHADLAICDEAAEYEDHEFFQRMVRTRVESQGGTVCLISTPVHENDLMAKVSDGTMNRECPECGVDVDKKDDEFICMTRNCENYGEEIEPYFNPKISEKGYWSETYPVWQELSSFDEHPDSFEISDKIVRPTFPENFDERSIRDLRKEDMTMFQKEYLCEPLAVEGDLFDPNDIIGLYDKDEKFEKKAKPGCKYYMGCDFAISRQGDYSVYTVVEVPPDDKPVIRYMQRLRGVDLASQEERIRNLHDIFNFQNIIIDPTNFGARTKRELIQSGLPIEGQSFQAQARKGILIGLKTSIEKGEFRIPRGSERSKQKTDVLYNELLGFGTTETDTGTETYKSTAKHDDTVMSLAMVINNIDESRQVDAMIAY